ncbi:MULTISPECIES: class B sortase [unclassified Sporosarcina]|uniref:class B sortase n=1 Tax=unclassified Sporosarcina TaxID=2647733 RepID=UPI00203C4A6F|nr:MULTISPECIES: class B sortase [unclassified Sporosarcina]GKV64068.1 SrtB family sortase [Sporosarcina sp. NCCP-2331]GLB56357.1 SrtB family sortase [Sporosarcina sp. NCCP-2378]
MKKRLSKLMPFVYLAVFLYSGYLLVQYLYTYIEAAGTLKETQEIYETALENEAEPAVSVGSNKEDILSRYTMRPQFDELHKINDDIVGWISVEGSKVNNPILQAEDNDFYLNRNFKGDYSRAGSVFMDYRNDVTDMSRNTVIYGHAMRNDTMFGSLKKFGDQDYANKHSVIYVDTLYEGYDIEVFAAYETTIDFYYIETHFQSDEEFAGFLGEVESRSLIEMPVEVGPDDKIVTLSTCNNSVNSKDKRYVVQGKLVKR